MVKKNFMEVEKFIFKPLGMQTGSIAAQNTAFKGGIAVSVAAPKQAEKQPANVVNDNQEVKEEERKKYTDKDISDARTSGYEEGYNKGYKAAKTEADELNKKINESLQNIGRKFDKIKEERKAEDAKRTGQIAEIVLRLAKKVADVSLLTAPLQRLEKAIEDSLEILYEEPALVIYVNNALVEDLEKRLAALFGKKMFKGKVDVKGRADIEPGSFNIEWEGGGMKSNVSELWQDIEKINENLFVKN